MKFGAKGLSPEGGINQKKSGAPLSERPAEGRREEIYLAAIASVFMPSARAKRPSEVRKVLSLRPLEAVSQ